LPAAEKVAAKKMPVQTTPTVIILVANKRFSALQAPFIRSASACARFSISEYQLKHVHQYVGLNSSWLPVS